MNILVVNFRSRSGRFAHCTGFAGLHIKKKHNLHRFSISIEKLYKIQNPSSMSFHNRKPQNLTTLLSSRLHGVFICSSTLYPTLRSLYVLQKRARLPCLSLWRLLEIGFVQELQRQPFSETWLIPGPQNSRVLCL